MFMNFRIKSFLWIENLYIKLPFLMEKAWRLEVLASSIQLIFLILLNEGERNNEMIKIGERNYKFLTFSLSNLQQKI